MKKLLSIFFSVLISINLVGCDNQTINNNTEINTVEEYKMNNYLDKMSSMLDDTYNDKNIMFSPLSLDMTLGMVANWANDEMNKAFADYFGMSVKDFNDFAESYNKNKPECIKLANSIWIKSKYKLNKDTKSIISNKYDAEIKTHKFDKSIMNDINKWCSNKTNKMIPEFIKEQPTSDTILLNALYFKGEWNSPFMENYTSKEEFTTFDGTKINIDMMKSTENTYLENDYATGFMKYYTDYRYAFIGILPKDTNEFNVADLDLESLLDSYSTQDVRVTLPKFEIESSFKLNDTLKSHGLSKIYEDNMFDKLLVNESIKVDNVLQATKITVDEKGTEASAITSMDMKCTSALPQEDPKVITLNRPFVFMIYDTEAKLPIFIGKYVMP